MNHTEVSSLISKLFNGTACETFPELRTKRVVIEKTLKGSESECLSSLNFGRKIALVCDPDTETALGNRVFGALKSNFNVQKILLDTKPHADEDTLQKLSSSTPSATDALVAVGSGTINDLCKMVAHEKKIPYAVFSTAPSMNGYTSVNAAITVGGLKKTLPATAPRGVFVDLEVMAAAPKRLIQSGLGDSLCRPTAQADWLLSHLLLGTTYQELPFLLLLDDEEKLFSQSKELVSGDLHAMENLARTLVLSGFGMTLCHGSYPASQGEHLISHYIDMMAAHLGFHSIPETYHGEQIGVVTLAMADLQKKILRRERPPVLTRPEKSKEQFQTHFGSKLGESCWKEFSQKQWNNERYSELNGHLEKNWNPIREKILHISKSESTLRKVLESADAPTLPEQLGWPQNLFSGACFHAREIRNRYTFLDLALDSEESFGRSF